MSQEQPKPQSPETKASPTASTPQAPKPGEAAKPAAPKAPPAGGAQIPPQMLQMAGGAGGPMGMPQAPAPDAAWNPKRHLIIGLTVLLILVGGFGGWAVFAQIAGAIVAPGQIEVDQNRQVVQHADGGIVSEILVDEGDLVAAGDPLIRLDGTLMASELAIIEGQLFELIARRGRLAAERDGQDTIEFDEELLQIAAEDAEVADLVDGQSRLFQARIENMDREIEQLGKRRIQIGNQIEGIEAQQRALESQLVLVRDELEGYLTLLKTGGIQRSRVLAVQREEVGIEGQLGDLAAQKAESEGRITELDIEALKLETQRREDAITRLRDLQYRELELAEQRRSLQEQMSRLEIRAPVSGIVYSLSVFAERSVIRAADPVLYIIPQDRPLVIATRVEPIHIDQVFPTQEVTLRFSALDARTTPELTGIVTTISADALTDEQSGISFYRAEVLIGEGEIEKLPEGVKLLPGMPVEAYLRTNDRTPLAYLLKPLADYFQKAFRET